MRKLPKLIILFLLFSGATSCKKYLDAKSDKALVVISSLQDLQSILDYYQRVSQTDPNTATAVSDDYFVKDATYLPLHDDLKNLYTWNNQNEFQVGYGNPWSQCYDNVYKANTVLSNIDKIMRTANNQTEWNNVKGQALFLRARGFLLAVSIWSLAYDKNTSTTDLGIPLRLDPDFNTPSERASVQQTYMQIINDLTESISLLPVKPLHVLRSSQTASCALLARTYLFMRQYDSCLKYASLSIQLNSDLLDYNGISTTPSYPFIKYRFGDNPEIIMDNLAPGSSLVSSTSRIDSILYKSYDANDLRKTLYFKNNGDGTFIFRGAYSGQSILWDGVSTDEVYLMRAEGYARMGKVTEAMSDVNALLGKRYKTGSFTPLTATDAADALNKVLAERRKELLMRNLRWMDIKRLNKEGANITLQRFINGQHYALPPNDPRSALALPIDLVSLYGLKQNP